jgi:PTS system nitrogen regulatory IIA component
MVAGVAVNAVRWAEAPLGTTIHALQAPVAEVPSAPFRCDRRQQEAHGSAEEKPEASSPALSDLISAEDILLDMQADRKRAALDAIARRLAQGVGVSPGTVLRALRQREGLGSTFIGDRVAMPHARIEGAARPAAALVRLRHPISFGNPDEDPVDLLLAVLWPEADAEGFVLALARIWRLLRRTELAPSLRLAANPEQAHGVIAAFEDGR